MVTAVAVNAALHGINEQTALGCGLGDLSGEIPLKRERSFGGLVRDELDRP